jgi:hypothetical protein
MTMEQNIRNIEGNVVEIQFKLDRNGKDFVTVTIQQDGLTYPTNVRARDATILERMKIVKQHLEAGSPVRLGFEIRESPRSEGGFFRDILRVTSVSLDDVPTDSPAPQSTPRSTQPSPAPSPWGTQIERISWNSGINNAFNKTEFREEEMTWIEYLKVVDSRAHDAEPLIARGPMSVSDRQQWYASVGWDAPERPQEAPDGAPDISDDPLDEQGPYPEDEEGVYEV